MTQPSASPIEILLVEDSPSDALLTREALALSKVYNTVHHVEDGMAALAFLRHQPPFEKTPRPGLILLDLNLPRKNGLEVLAEIKGDPALAGIPVVVLTTSSGEEDVVKSYGSHANCYVVKPLDFEQLAQVVSSIQEFWFSVVTLPPKS